MKKNGSESSTASMSTGSAYMYGEEDAISTARRGSSNVSGSLSGTVSSLSGSIATYQVSFVDGGKSSLGQARFY
jgi:hypothetical protein